VLPSLMGTSACARATWLRYHCEPALFLMVGKFLEFGSFLLID